MMTSRIRKPRSNKGCDRSVPRVYAVANGREGAKIYHTLDEYKENVEGVPGGMGKRFDSLKKAHEWLNELARGTKDGSRCLLPSSNVETTSSEAPTDMDTTEDVPSATNVPEHHLSTYSVPGQRTERSILCDRIEGVQPLGSSSVNDCGVPDPVPDRVDSDPSVPQCSGSVPIPVPPPLPAQDRVQRFGEGLSGEQKEILKVVDRGESIFFTGAAGTGKSVTLRAIIKMMRDKFSMRKGALAVTASTGIAALNIGGGTLHYFAGVGLGKKPVKDLLGTLYGKKKARRRWKMVRTLIIDEISMVDGSFFDKLEEIARKLRRSTLPGGSVQERPFGGIQLIICGDFFQLPPVPDQYKGAPVPACFAFDAKSWCHCVKLHMRLTKVFRQKDFAFISILNQMRVGKADPNLAAIMQSLGRDIEYNGIEPVEIYPRNAQVEAANVSRLNALPGKTFFKQAIDRGRWEEGEDKKDEHKHQERISNLLDRGIAPRSILLKEKAQVMLVRNLVQGQLVNGSLGRVVSFATVLEARNQGILTCTEILTKQLEEQLGAQPEPDQASQNELRRLEEVTEEFTIPDQAWPVVEFGNKDRVLFTPLPFDMEDAFGDLEATRVQVPLILAWAITVHKSQGQTIERLKIDFKGTFENGQAYVAMSRAVGMDTLQVLNFEAMMVRAHPRVLDWDKDVIWVDEQDSEEAIQAYFSQQS